jgi:hypothetical protein
MIGYLTSEWNRLVDTLSPLHDDYPTFLPDDYIKWTFLPATFTTTAIVTLIYLLSFNLVDKLIPPDSPAVKKSRVCYQIANVCFNVSIGCTGLYMEYWVLPKLRKNEETFSTVVGQEQELYLLSAMQLGYQIWAMPVGVIYVNETYEMLLHHLAVVISSSTCGFLSIGFRYYTPFFFGIMELSSIPLSIMNSFKDHEDWAKKYPAAFEASRIVFAVSYLAIRIVLCAWRWPPFLRDSFILMYTKEFGVCKMYMLIQWCFAAFLQFLQIFWARIILKNVLKVLLPPKDGDKKNESKRD